MVNLGENPDHMVDTKKDNNPKFSTVLFSMSIYIYGNTLSS